MGRFLLPFLALVSSTFAQSPACPTVLPRTELQWKYGPQEQAAFLKATAAKGTDQFALLDRFLAEYPESDYGDAILILKMSSAAEANDSRAAAEAARKLLRPASAETLLAAYTILATATPSLITANNREQQLQELNRTVRCGRSVLNSLNATAEVQRGSEFAFSRAAGFLAYAQKDYITARRELDAALNLGPQDVTTNLLLALTELVGEPADTNAGTFHLARASELAPGTAVINKAFEDVYSAIHGSLKGVDKVRKLARTNSTPPPGFKIDPPKERSATASRIISGILVGGLVGWSAYAAAQGGGVGPTTSTVKLMIFGGQDHRTYLGCLNCSEYASDSVFNHYGQNGSAYSSTSIWNHYSDFGSAYSAHGACSRYAQDPPVIVDQDGKFYGRLTLNEYHPQIGLGKQYLEWLTTVCGG